MAPSDKQCLERREKEAARLVHLLTRCVPSTEWGWCGARHMLDTKDAGRRRWHPAFEGDTPSQQRQVALYI